MPRTIRLRDFIADADNWLYAVSSYGNRDTVGCILRYIPDSQGDRTDCAGRRYRKLEFEEAFARICAEKPYYAGRMHRIPIADVRRLFCPEQEISRIADRDRRVRRLQSLLDLPAFGLGCTGSRLVGLETPESDIDLVAYGASWFQGQARLRDLIATGAVQELDEEMWRVVYRKRSPEIPFETFILHERRKYNRGMIDGTYFDLLYARDEECVGPLQTAGGEVVGRKRIRARVRDARLAFDSPALYEVDHEEVSRVLSFTHTYSGQVVEGEEMEAQGVLEQHGRELWLIVGTTRTAKGEYIVSRTLLEEGNVSGAT
ncbi:MAG: DNA polymerase subunit beta [Methanomicrobiales archaeon]|nr:DNA polymerase subunit beta [Methanomicrobiales archaeon]